MSNVLPTQASRLFYFSFALGITVGRPLAPLIPLALPIHFRIPDYPHTH